MISLSRHIELLLLEHNCVIVPGLGGFIANTASAVYNDGPDGDKLFIPPYRTIAFNPQLQINDGLLVQSYMQAYDASYPAAYMQMEKEIELLNMQLDLFGECHLDGIGTLHKSLGQSIVLNSPEAGILTPSLYGTYSFGIKSAAEVIREREIQEAANQKNIMPIQTEADLVIQEKVADKTADTEKPVVPIKRKDKRKNANGGHNYWAEFGVAAAIAAIIFLVWLIPNTVTMNGKKETAIAGAPYLKIENIKKDNKVKAPKPEVKAAKPVAETDVPAPKAETASPESELKDEPKEKTEPEVAKNWTIVLASFVTEKNSNILIEKLASEGLAEAKFVQKGKTTRVIYSAYATESDAVNALIELRSKNEVFKEAWTMKMN